MGLYRILNRDRSYHLTVQNTVKEFVQTVEYDLRMYSTVPGWTLTPIKVRQDLAIRTVRSKNGSVAAQKLQSILARRTVGLEKLWLKTEVEKQESCKDPYIEDPEIESLLTM